MIERLNGYMESWRLGAFLHVKGTLRLIGNGIYMESSEQHSRKIVIIAKSSKPKRINRRLVLYTDDNFNKNNYYLLYVDDSDEIRWCEKIDFTINLQNEICFVITDFLKEKEMDFEFPERSRVSFGDKVWMHRYLTFEPYGFCSYIPSTGIAWDGTGDGENYYIRPGYVRVRDTDILYMHIHGYYAEPQKKILESFLMMCEEGKTILAETFREMLGKITEGSNELFVGTRNVYVGIYKHYSSRIEVSAFGQKRSVHISKWRSSHSLNGQNNQEKSAIGDFGFIGKEDADLFAELIMNVLSAESFDEISRYVDVFVEG